MNERIQELLIEAHKQTKGGIYNGHLSEWTEKFAELIVLEVLAVQEQLISEGHNAWHLNKPTKEHFGVE
jgi:hypothetical protein